MIDDQLKGSSNPIHVFLFGVKERSDKLVNYFLVCYFLFGLLLAPFYDTWVIALSVGSLLLVAYYSARLFLPNSSLYQYVLSTVLGIFMALFIYQMHGMFELHFFAFIGSAILITYQKWKLQIPIFIVVMVHHAVFGYLQDNGFPQIYFSQLAYFDFQTFVIHILLTGVIYFICGLWAYQLHRHNSIQIIQTQQMVELQKDAQLSLERIRNGEVLAVTNGQLRKLNKELEKARQMAEQSLSSKDIFLANMSHEIRTPINAVLGMSKLMEKTTLVPPQQHYMNIISNATSSLMFIINDILDFSKISAGKLSLERIGFYMEDVISSSMDMVAYNAKGKGLELIKNMHTSKQVFIGDPFRLKQVFLNLLTNAVKFTKKGSVAISCYENELYQGKRHLTIQVKDTGKGMDEAFLHILFEKFTQEDDSISRSYSGTGLGMSISKHLIELMGGTITVESEKNIGTTFYLDFYFERGDETDLFIPEKVEVDILALKNKHILLVEDNEMNQLVAQTILEQNGMKVSIAANGEQAVEQVNNTVFDLVLMDMQMPVMDGLQATGIIRKTNREIPIVALTANALQGERDKCLVAGMDDFLAKPFEEEVLLALLCKWLDKKTGNYLNTIFDEKSIAENLALSKIVDEPDALFTLEQLKAISPGNIGFLDTVINMFIIDANETAGKMFEAFKQRDYQSIKLLTHRIKPSIYQFDIAYKAQMKRIDELCTEEMATEELETLIIGFGTLMAKILPLMQKEVA